MRTGGWEEGRKEGQQNRKHERERERISDKRVKNEMLSVLPLLTCTLYLHVCYCLLSVVASWSRSSHHLLSASVDGFLIRWNVLAGTQGAYCTGETLKMDEEETEEKKIKSIQLHPYIESENTHTHTRTLLKLFPGVKFVNSLFFVCFSLHHFPLM